MKHIILEHAKSKRKKFVNDFPSILLLTLVW